MPSEAGTTAAKCIPIQLLGSLRCVLSRCRALMTEVPFTEPWAYGEESWHLTSKEFFFF